MGRFRIWTRLRAGSNLISIQVDRRYRHRLWRFLDGGEGDLLKMRRRPHLMEPLCHSNEFTTQTTRPLSSSTNELNQRQCPRVSTQQQCYVRWLNWTKWLAGRINDEQMLSSSIKPQHAANLTQMRQKWSAQPTNLTLLGIWTRISFIC